MLFGSSVYGIPSPLMRRYDVQYVSVPLLDHSDAWVLGALPRPRRAVREDPESHEAVNK